MNYASLRVLIVEDQRPFLLMLKGLLTTLGCTDVVTKSSAEQALSVCRRQKFDIVISDLHLGTERKTGYDLAEELRVSRMARPGTVVSLISADSARPVVLGSLDRRPDDYLVKPFSQAQLKTRLARAWQKRQALLPVYKAIHDHDYAQAIVACQEIIRIGGNYRHSAEQLLVELYWQHDDYSQALEVLRPYEQDATAQWIQIALARTYLKLGKAEQAIAMAETILVRNRFSADAYDIMAQSRQAINEGEAAVAAIIQAIKISPYSIARQVSACEIARQNNDYELANQACLAIWDLSRRTVHQHISHWCGYIRSMLDVAEYTEDKRVKNRYQQDALLQLQRGRFDDSVNRLDEDFSFETFEQIMLARIAALDGKYVDAKRDLHQAQSKINTTYDNYPLYYAADSVKVMLELGEYEEAQPLIKLMHRHVDELDANSRYSTETASRKAADNKKAYLEHNRDGIAHYQKEDYEQARTSFLMAQQYAPVNTGVALNLLQCLLKLADKKKPLASHTAECRRLCNMLDDIPLKPQHQEKYASLYDDIVLLLRR